MTNKRESGERLKMAEQGAENERNNQDVQFFLVVAGLAFLLALLTTAGGPVRAFLAAFIAYGIALSILFLLLRLVRAMERLTRNIDQLAQNREKDV